MVIRFKPDPDLLSGHSLTPFLYSVRTPLHGWRGDCRKPRFLFEDGVQNPAFSNGGYSRTSLMTPAPTVRPPSRMANRHSFSIAIGVINSTDNDTLPPGITISPPSGKVATPVTSVI